MSLMRELICPRVRAMLAAVPYSQCGVHHDDPSQRLHDVFEELRAVEPMPQITVAVIVLVAATCTVLIGYPFPRRVGVLHRQTVWEHHLAVRDFHRPEPHEVIVAGF